MANLPRVGWHSHILPKGRYPPKGDAKFLCDISDILLVTQSDRPILEDQIKYIVADFFYIQEEIKNAPTAANLRSRLKKLETRLSYVSQELNDPYLRSALKREMSFFGRAYWTVKDDFASWKTGIKKLAEFSKFASEKPATGGRGNLFDREYANPKATLVHGCALLAMFARPEILSGSDDGQFIELCSFVYEFATGEDPFGEGVGLHRYSKVYAPLARRVLEIHRELESKDLTIERAQELDDELDQILEEKMFTFGEV